MNWRKLGALLNRRDDGHDLYKGSSTTKSPTRMPQNDPHAKGVSDTAASGAHNAYEALVVGTFGTAVPV
jgi:hypothetical protein